MSLYQTLYEGPEGDAGGAVGKREVVDPEEALQSAIEMIEARDHQLENLLRGMEELNDELRNASDEKELFRQERDELKRELENAIRVVGSIRVMEAVVQVKVVY